MANVIVIDRPTTTPVVTPTHKEDIELPKMHRVLVLNDDFTPFYTVVEMLQLVFGLDEGKAHKLMVTAHQTGSALVGMFTAEIAESKVAQTKALAADWKVPLQFTHEPE